jgi:uncharacterized membrane protein required for colicin V production
MILILLATALILAIAFFQATQGFYSATIMAILSVLSVLVAFNYYEPLAASLAPRLATAADAVALLALFVILLLVLRLAIDFFLRRNAVMDIWINRIGGGAMGLLAGTVLVGVGAIVLQMLPWGPSILGYTPFDDSLQRSSKLYPFAPDDFVLGTVNTLSRQSLGAGPTHLFHLRHDDLLLELFCARNTAGKNGRTDAPADALSVGNAYVSEGAAWGSDVPADPRLGQQVSKVIVIRAKVNQNAADKDKWWRLPATHFRLVTRSGRSYYPVGYMVRSTEGIVCVPAPTEEGNLHVTQLIVERPVEEKTLAIDWAYRLLPEDTPATLVFRQVSYAAVPKPIPTFPDLSGGLGAVP